MFLGCCTHSGINGQPWQPPQNGGCEAWIAYHKKLVSMYGRTKANELWLYYWDRLSGWSSEKNWCKYDNNFTGYLKSQGIDVGNIFSDIYNAGGDVLDAATGTISVLAKVAKIALPVLAVYLVGRHFNIWK